ncbi:MAG TPA: hypothetical protein VMR98_03470, partial [Candidatus Polarisedimenticolaceae bacterium]|nr:hypothetical protein [Candidatus Polarisedimenticolaceae bacterium]
MGEHSDPGGEQHQPEQPQSEEFNFDAWLLERRTGPEDFVMVEIGHGLWPVAFNQEFKGRQAYVGVEGWLRHESVKAEELNRMVATQHADENLFLVDNPINPEEYSAESKLPEGIADEVFMANVLGDPRTQTHERTPHLLDEAARLLEDDGKLIIREVMEPDI